MSKMYNGNPHEQFVEAIGGLASSTAPTAVAANAVIAPWHDLNGRAQVNGDTSMTPLLVTPASTVTLSSGTITLTVGATYASGDFVGTSSTPISFTGAARTSGGGGKIVSLTVSDPAASTATALELWLFSATITPPADSAAWDLSDASGLLCEGVISIPTTAQYVSSATGVMSVNNIDMRYKCAATTLFGALVTRGAPTYTGSLVVKLRVELD